MVGVIRGTCYRSLAAGTTFVLAGVSHPMPAQAPAVSHIPDSAACATCALQMRTLVTLGAASGAGELTRSPNGIAIDPQGRYWVLAGGPPRIYSPGGRFLQTLGQRGSGPGQFEDPYAAAVLPGDSMLVLDPVLGRAAVVSPKLRVSREIDAPWPVTRVAVLKWPTAVVLSGDILTPDQIGWPLHVASFAGSRAIIRHSFGPDSGKLLVGGRTAIAQLITANGGRLWAADFSHYRITQWTTEGAWLQSLIREAPWFPPSNVASLGGPNVAPAPAITGLELDSLGLIWVAAKVPGSHWAAAWPSLPSGIVDVPVRNIHLDLLYGSAIEVIDPTSARVLTRRRMDEWVVAILPGHRAAVYSTDAQGVRHLTIVELKLTGR
jgi:hypothetical protein